MARYSINLLQADLLPKKPLWNLNRVAGLWAGSFVLMMALSALFEYRLSEVRAQHQRISVMEGSNKNKLAQLELNISQNRNDATLAQKLKTIKLMLANKQNLHQQLTDPKQTYSAGFSLAMSELAQLHDKNISLQHVNISFGNMTFAGLARTPDAVPSWLSGFESSTFLSGKSFVHFSLLENEQKMTEFVVSSNPKREVE